MKKFCLIIAVLLVFVVSCDNLYNDVAEEKKDMQKLIFVNADGVSVDLTKDPYGITEWEGFSKVDLNLQTQQVPFHDGSVYLDGLLSERELSVTLAMNDEKNLEKRYRLRRELIEILNPKLGEGVLIYTNNYTSKQIKVIPQTPLFENHNSNDSGTPKASLAWTACDPYWEDVDESSVIFGTFEEIEIINTGDVPCAIKADIFIEDCENPTINQVNTGKTISVQGEYEDIIKVNTISGEKSVNTERLANTIMSNMNYILDVVFWEEKQMFVGAGNGIVYRSYDGINWVSTPIANAIFETIIYVESKKVFIIVGDKSSIYISNDAENWVKTNIPDSNITLLDVCYSSALNTFVVCGTKKINNVLSGSAYVSSDLVNWTKVLDNGADVCGVACSSDKIIMVAHQYVYISQNAIDWTVQTLPIIFFSDGKSPVIACSPDGVFCIVGQVFNESNILSLTSTNGTTWTSTNTGGGNRPYKLLWSKKLNAFYFCDVYYGRYSTTGDSWSETTGVDRKNYCDYSNGLFCYSTGRIATTSDFTNWQEKTFPYYSVYDVLFNDGKIIISGNSYIGVSKNLGLTFEKTPMNYSIKYVIYNTDRKKYIAISSDNNPNIYQSNDAKEWQSVTRLYSHRFLNIIYSKLFHKYYAIITTSNESRQISESTNMIEWNSLGYNNMYSICESNNKLVVGGYNKIVYSTDGETFNECTINGNTSTYIIRDIMFVESTGKYYAVSDSGINPNSVGYIGTSTDGIVWNFKQLWSGTKRPTNLIFSNNMNIYLVVCDDMSYYISYNGESWELQNFDNSESIDTIIFVPEMDSFLGCGGTTLQQIKLNIEQNLVSKLTQNSDLTMALKKGSNRFAVTATDGDALCRISYRQRYIGV